MAMEPDILYEDNHLIVVNKAISDIVQGDKTGDESLDKKIKAFIKVRDNKPGNVYLGIPHRIDRPVSGAIIYTKTSKALSRVNESFRLGKAEKIYHAIVKEKPNPVSGRLENYIRKNEKQNKSYITSETATGAKLAKLEYKLIASSDNYHLLEVRLLTGRHHQIRLQLASIGCPIKGDLKYGFPRSNKNGGISLHARSISITHPTTGEILNIEAPYPGDDIFGVFA
ncbi:MAG: RluA family pseudouridine synthase [Bacteroidales bacterium]|nr:RluA family pseudouridine synthase [Bacteroidales bacterium]MCF8391451.1 RluA family pseudouridine synthase [Bacteroidales bacterium]